MSIAAFIDNPETDDEKNFYLPISTEQVFDSSWQPGCQSLGLQWILNFAVGIDISKKDLPSIISELNQLKDWAKGNLSDSENKQVIERIEILTTKLPLVFSRQDVIVSIF